jgi:TolB-like protein/tetratricopeptide (TPR) repeat protein
MRAGPRSLLGDFAVASRIRRFLAELKRRKVYHVAVAYLVVGWGVGQGAEFLFGDVLQLQPVVWQMVLGLVILGFPIALVLAWAYELKPEEKLERSADDEPEAGSSENQSKNSIIVLPFDNLSPDPADVYFSAGLTEEVTATLSEFRSLRVISRSSAVAYKEAFKDVGTIARDLNVQYLLEGSVRKAGDDLRITVQLIDARTDEHIWSEKYDGKLEDVFGMQEQVSRSIVDSLKIRLSPREERALSSWPISDPQAYDTYLLAMHESRKMTEEGLTRAVGLIEEALHRIGENARLSAILAICKFHAYDWGFSHTEETLGEVEEWAAKALQLDPDLGLAHYAKAVASYKRGDLEGFVQAAKRSVELEPNSDASALLGFVLAEVGKTDEAFEYAEAAVESDPLSFFAFWGVGALEIFLGRPEEALKLIDGAVGGFATKGPFGVWWEAQALGYAGEEIRAKVAYQRVVEMGAGFLSDLSDLFVKALSEDVQGVREVLNRHRVQETAGTDEYFPLYIANALARIGEIEGALEWLEMAVSKGFTNHDFLANHNRYLEPLRNHPTFRDLMDSARKEQTAFVS